MLQKKKRSLFAFGQTKIFAYHLYPFTSQKILFVQMAFVESSPLITECIKRENKPKPKSLNYQQISDTFTAISYALLNWPMLKTEKNKRHKMSLRIGLR